MWSWKCLVSFNLWPSKLWIKLLWKGQGMMYSFLSMICVFAFLQHIKD
jgi:hypothetical protein